MQEDRCRHYERSILNAVNYLLEIGREVGFFGSQVSVVTKDVIRKDGDDRRMMESSIENDDQRTGI